MDNIIKIKYQRCLLQITKQKIIEIYNMVNNKEKKIKLEINMTTKSLSRKQVVIPMSTNNLEDITSSHLLQLKLYLKILEIPYLLENSNLSITSDIIEEVIKSFYLFNDITLACYP